MRGSTHRSGSTARTTARIVLPDGSPLSRASDEEQIWISHMISSDEEQIWISHMISSDEEQIWISHMISDEEQIWISHMISDEEQIWISHMISDPGLMKELVREDDAVDVTKQRPSSSFTVDLHSRPSLPPRRHAAAGVELCERLATSIRACTTHSSPSVASHPWVAQASPSRGALYRAQSRALTGALYRAQASPSTMTFP